MKNNFANSKENLSRGSHNRFFDPYRNSTFGPGVPLVNDWRYIHTDFYVYQNGEASPPFLLSLKKIQDEMGTLDDIQVYLMTNKILSRSHIFKIVDRHIKQTRISLNHLIVFQGSMWSFHDRIFLQRYPTRVWRDSNYNWKIAT